MDLLKQIRQSLNKAERFLIDKQNDDGSWTYDSAVPIQGPEHLHRPLFLTAMAVNTLLLIAPKHTSSISKGIQYISEQSPDSNDHIDLIASQLWGLKAANTSLLQKQSKELLDLILSKRNDDGIWREFSGASNLTLYGVILGIRTLCGEEAYKKIRRWLLKHKAKDGKGWGLHENYDESQVSFTCNAALTLIYSGEDPLHQDLQQAKEFLLDSMLDDKGGWPSSVLTIPADPTSYGTALAIVTLLHLHNDPTDEKINAGINCLLDMQLPDGSFPLKKGNEVGEYYTTYYATKALSYYYNLIYDLQKEELKLLQKHIDKPQYLSRYILRDLDLRMQKHYQQSYAFDLLESSLATTAGAAKRRKVIMRILSEQGAKDVAEMIDELKKEKAYKDLSKRSHLAQIKNDLDSLCKIGLVIEHRRKYFMTRLAR